MSLKFLKAGEKKKLLNELEEKFGMGKLSYLLVETGKQKIRGFSGSMSKEELIELDEIANVEIVGLYLIRKDEKFGLRLGFDGSMALKEQIVKNVTEISDSDVGKWMKGDSLEIEGEKGVFVLRSENSSDYLGCGAGDGKKIINFVPKERRIRNG